MKYIIAIVCLMLFSAGWLKAQSDNEGENARMIESKNFIFMARTALPMKGQLIQLTSEYDLTIAVDTLISSLPYFGRAFSAPIDPRQGGFMFTSTNFSYTVKKKNRKKRWDITIEPKDSDQANRFFLTVFANGSASLQVSSNNRQPISFNGYIVAGKPRDKKAF